MERHGDGPSPPRWLASTSRSRNESPSRSRRARHEKPSFRSRIPQVIKPAVLSATEKVRDAVVVEVHGCGTHVMTLDVLLCQRSYVAEEKLAIWVIGLAQEVRVG